MTSLTYVRIARNDNDGFTFASLEITKALGDTEWGALMPGKSPLGTYSRGMAEILTFPVESQPDVREVDSQLPQLPPRPEGVPDAVWDAVESVRAMRRVNEVRYREIPVPSTLADYGIGVEMESGTHESGTHDGSITPHDEASAHLASGWIMLLYGEQSRIDWNGHWRCVAFARLPLEASENDSLTPAMYWEDMCGYLIDVEPDSVSGTVTITQNTSFGALGGDTSAGCEMRVSFTPLTIPEALEPSIDAGELVAAWGEFLKSTVRIDKESYGA